MKDTEPRSVLPEEIRSDAMKTYASSKEEPIMTWLRLCRDLEAADRDEAFAAKDNVKANEHDRRCMKFAAALDQLIKLTEMNNNLTAALRNREDKLGSSR